MTKETKKEIKIDSDTRYRVSIFRSNNDIYAQIIDDAAGVTLVSASSKEIKEKKTPVESAIIVGESLAKKASSIKIVKVYFDRGRYQYHGRVKALAEGLRKGGLNF